MLSIQLQSWTAAAHAVCKLPPLAAPCRGLPLRSTPVTPQAVLSVYLAEGCQQGLCPVWVNPHSGLFHGFDKTLGARGDSYYEYLLKYWILTGKTDEAILR